MGWQGVFLATLVGLAFGSFAALLLDRLPHRQSILWPRSRCSSCTRTLSALELVPVISYLLLRGRCKHCQCRIPARVVLVELLTGICAGGACALWGLSGAAITLGLLLAGACGAGLFARVRPGGPPEAGFTLVESVVAVALLMAVLVPVTTLYIRSWHFQAAVHDRLLMTNLAKEKLDEIQGIALQHMPVDHDWDCVSAAGAPPDPDPDPSADPLRYYEWRWKVEPTNVQPDTTGLYRAQVDIRKNRCGSGKSPAIAESAWTFIRKK